MYRDVLAVRPFRNLWIGQAISQLGDALYYLVFVFMVDKLTGNATLVGITAAIQALPYVFFGLQAGVLADRHDRRRILLFSDVSSALLLLGFAGLLLGWSKPPVAAIFLIAFLLNTVNVFFAPAKSAAIPRLVRPDLLVQANALSMATQNLMPMIGIGLSGAVLGGLYAVAPDMFFLSAVLLNAVSFLISASFLRTLPALPPERGEVPHPWQDLRDGLTFIRRNASLKVLLLTSVMSQFFIAPFMVAYVVVNREWFGGNYWTLALCEFTFFLAMVGSSLAVGRFAPRKAGSAFIWGITLTGLTVAGMALSRSFGWFVFMNFLAGIALPFAQLPMATYMQLIVPDEFRGRVNSVLAMASSAAIPLAAGLAGAFIAWAGLPATFLVMGLGMGAAGLIGLLVPEFRRATLPATA